ncbi:MAG: hypothetical protein IPP13_18195 [Kouleothrix sp.]|nr:hypothetical protein [Kouleothrix sp.]
MITDILIWWFTIQLLGLLGLPLTQWLLRALPDRGYAFSKSLGLLLAGYLAWLLAMLGLAPFGRALAIVCALAVGLAGWLAARGHAPGAWLRRYWRRVLAYEVAFAAAFVFMVLLRSYQPDPWGTERPMDYALFNAIRVSASFPPHDPWLAGYSINYYYFGYLLMALLSLISGIGQGVAYNLSLASIFALTALGLAGLVVNLIDLTSTSHRQHATAERAGRRWPAIGGRIGAALLAIALVLGVGNQGGALQVISGADQILALKGGDMARVLANGLGARQPLAIEPPFRGADFDGLSLITPEDRTANFNWWNPSRALWDSFPPALDDADQRPIRNYAITEFPFFSFWLGDMHPHVMALPFGLLALALALATLARPNAPNFTMGRRGWAELALTAIVLGSLYLINSWDLPTYVLLYLGALVILYTRLGRPAAPALAAAGIDGQAGAIPRDPFAGLARVWWRHLAGQAIPLLLASWLLFAPFHLTFRSLVGGNGSPLGLVTWSRTPLHTFLIIFGLFLAPLLAYVLLIGRQPAVESDPEAQPEATAASRIESAGIVHHQDTKAPRIAALPAPPLGYLAWAVLGALALGVLAGFPLLALLPLAIYAAGLALAQAERPAAAFALWAFALICLVCFGTEVVYIRDVFSSRMNTIFKFYYQAWLIWGVLAAYALWWLLGGLRAGPKAGALLTRIATIAGLLLFAVLLAGALVYPALTAGKIFREGQRVGLAGTTPAERSPEGAAAIDWLRANTPGDAVLLEAVGDDYDGRGLGANAVSASTGRPTVLGWPGHEDQWRGGDPTVRAQIGPRKADVAAIYSSTDAQQAAELLKKYNVSYIYVGAAERASYPPEGLAKLAQLGDVAFQQGDVIIYKVR